jgi:elongator complex protein 3
VSAVSADSLIGFLRLRFPPAAFLPELEGAALVRELHVYGSMVPLGRNGEDDDYQHRNYGTVLLAHAEGIARDAGYPRVAIMSGIGVRPYYRKHGYVRTGPYMIKELG